jgi:hypothetical protein
LTFLFALLLSCATSFAYIPEYSLIASHAADQHGKGTYLIEQEVTYRKDTEAYTVKETWLVNGENNMRVTLEGRGPLKGLVQGTMIIDGSQKYFFEPTANGLRQQKLGEEWLEPLFHFRSSKYLRSRLVSLKVAPPESLHDRNPLSSEGDPEYQAPSYLRLSRVGGTIAWAIGMPATTAPRPALWLEQDQFVLRKYRGNSQIVVHANDYQKYEDGLWYPKQRIYNFGPYIVEVQTLQVKSLGKGKDDRFRTNSLSAARDVVKLPDAPGLKEFYSRFR